MSKTAIAADAQTPPLTIIICENGEPIGAPIPVGEFKPHKHYNDMLAYVSDVRAPYRVEVRLTRTMVGEEQNGCNSV